MTHPPSEHFKGKNVADHLREVRQRGKADPHASLLPGHILGGIEGGKEIALSGIILWAFSLNFPLNSPLLSSIFLSFSFGWTLWKTGRIALLGWSQLEHLHQVIEQERWEIEHHREQEREEVRELYAAKGFSGKLLDEVVAVLMADDNRLLKVMLEEEMGLQLERIEHPIKQACVTFFVSLFVAAAITISFHFPFSFAPPAVATLVILLGTYLAARHERRSKLRSIIWYFSLTLFIAIGVYLVGGILSSSIPLTI